MNRRFFVAGSLAASCSQAMATPRSINRLIALNTAARGGARRMNALNSMASVVRITEPGFTVIGRYLADARGQVRVDVYRQGRRVFSEGVDATGVWELAAGDSAPKEGSEKGRQALLHGIEFNLIGLNRMASRGHRLALSSPPFEAGLYGLKLSLHDGFETRLFISPKNWQIVARRDERAYHVDLDPTVKRVESRFSDFRKSGGIVTPFRSQDIDLGTGKQVGESETISIDWNIATEALMARDAPALPAPQF